MNEFDRPRSRKGTASVKWDFLEKNCGGSDLLPLWVADMDFPSPPEVVEALTKRVEEGIYGYTDNSADYFSALEEWNWKRHGWRCDPSWVVSVPGVVPALNMAVRAFTKPGDKVLVQRPVYYPFMNSIELNGARVINSPLVLRDKRYRMDPKDLEEKLSDPRCRMMILCSPHNPVGRVWEEGELRLVADLCRERGVLLVSDEIHSDLVFPGFRHRPLLSIDPSYSSFTLLCTSPSKSFNLAGLQCANMIVPDPILRRGILEERERLGLFLPNFFGGVALEAAYRYGEPWLERLMAYLKGNLDLLKRFLGERLSEAILTEPEGTYLAWVDLRGVERDWPRAEKILLERAKVAYDPGILFGPEGEGHIRINLACPRALLQEALERTAQAFGR